MKIKDAFAILNIQSNFVTPSDIKAAYRKAAAKYHPDHNPAGLEMMKLVNMAYEVLKNYHGKVTTDEEAKNYGEALNTALNDIINLGLTIIVCGVWVWVSGNTRPFRETLKSAGYKWAPKKQSWYFRPPEHKSFNRTPWSMEKIKSFYGTENIDPSIKQIQVSL